MRRANWIYLAAAALVLISGVSGAGATTPYNRFLKSLQEKQVATPKANAAAAKANAARRAAARRKLRTTTTTKPRVTTTTRKATTTTRATTTTSTPPAPVASPPAPPTPPPPAAPCAGVAMTRGQADIDASPEGTTFCLSGTHNWSLNPKNGNKFIGPAVLDGSNSTKYAIQSGSATSVVLANLEIRNYTVASQQGAIFVPDWARPIATGWKLLNLQVHNNGTSAGGAGANLGVDWQVLGGRYYNNRQEGLGGSGSGAVVDGAEIDHNNFTNDSYTTRNTDCAWEAGGFKLVANNVTVKNSKIHDNACKGLWTDIGSNGAVITNNQVYNNWDEGIFIEISSGATITHNAVWNNGWHTVRGAGSSGSTNACPWLWGGGITLASSDNVEIAHNAVSGNCNGITGTQQHRPEGNPGLLENVNIHDNAVAGPVGRTGVISDNGANLATRNIRFTNNTISNGMQFCGLNC